MAEMQRAYGAAGYARVHTQLPNQRVQLADFSCRLLRPAVGQLPVIGGDAKAVLNAPNQHRLVATPGIPAAGTIWCTLAARRRRIVAGGRAGAEGGGAYELRKLLCRMYDAERTRGGRTHFLC